MTTETAGGVIVIVCAAALWLWAVLWSRKTFPFLACAACNGTGRVFEPWIVAWLCLRFKQRAWRPCATCGGTARKERRKRL